MLSHLVHINKKKIDAKKVNIIISLYGRSRLFPIIIFRSIRTNAVIETFLQHHILITIIMRSYAGAAMRQRYFISKIFMIW